MKQYGGLEPRISLLFRHSGSGSFKLSYNRIHQYMNLLSNATVVTPTDVWKLSDTYLKPLKADQLAVGYFRNFANNKIEASLEVYYKHMYNVLEYKEGAKLLLNEHLEQEIMNAQGYNYGAEMYINKRSGRFTGWASYTYSKAMRKTDMVWPSNFDVPHNLMLNSSCHISRRFRFGATFMYSTGRPTTIPEMEYNYGKYKLIYFSERKLTGYLITTGSIFPLPLMSR